MLISKETWQKTCSLIKKQDGIIQTQNKVITRLKEEVNQCNKLIGLYEACINKGIQIDFPDVTGEKKGDIVGEGDTEFNFDDF